jgi:hypothetical protein
MTHTEKIGAQVQRYYASLDGLPPETRARSPRALRMSCAIAAVPWSEPESAPLADIHSAVQAAENDPRLGRNQKLVLWIGGTPYATDTHSPPSSDRVLGES